MMAWNYFGYPHTESGWNWSGLGSDSKNLFDSNFKKVIVEI